MSNSFFEQVAADKNQLGFEYQDLVCLEYLIDLKPGETVGLEVFDDVHHERVSGTKALVQVKHSVSDDSTLTNRDIDLWKTLHNWSSALEALATENIEFIFFTNKKKTNQSGIIQLLESKNKDTSQLFDTVSEIKQDIDDKEQNKVDGAAANPIKKYVDHINGLTDSKKKGLFSKITMVFSADDILKRLAEKVEYFSVSKTDSLEVVYQLIGVFKKQKYELIKSGKKFKIDYATFRKDFQFNRIIEIARVREVDFSRYSQFKNVNTIDPKDGEFAKQLSDIDISSEQITEYAMEYAATNMFIQKLIADGNFSTIENSSINDEIFQGWKSISKEIYNLAKINNESEHKQTARDCLYKTGGQQVQVSNSFLSRGMVEGKAIELSDIHRIGWRKDWKDLYGTKK